jgi:hypothetical protein
MSVLSALGAAGRRRSPATMPGYHAGRPPRNTGLVVVATALRLAGSGGPPRRSQRALPTALGSWLGCERRTARRAREA